MKYFKVCYTRKLNGSKERLKIVDIVVTENDLAIMRTGTRFEYKVESAVEVAEPIREPDEPYPHP